MRQHQLSALTTSISSHTPGRRPPPLHDGNLSGNDYFGMALQDGSFLESNDLISGVAGVAVIAGSADTHAALNRIKIANTSGAPLQKFERDGFAATTN